MIDFLGIRRAIAAIRHPEPSGMEALFTMDGVPEHLRETERPSFVVPPVVQRVRMLAAEVIRRELLGQGLRFESDAERTAVAGRVAWMRWRVREGHLNEGWGSPDA